MTKPQRIPFVPIEDMPATANPKTGHSSISRLMAHAPTVRPGYGQFIEAVFARLSLDPMERELAVLATLHLEGGEYQWAHHEVIGEALGVSPEQIAAIGRGEFDSPLFDARQQTYLAFVRQMVENVRVDDATFAAAAKFFSSRELIETIFAAGNYMILARITEVAQIPPDPPFGIESLRAAEAKVAAERSAEPQARGQA